MATESLPERAAGRRRPELEPQRGMRLGRYELLVPLASGGMAQVWTARLAGEHGFERLFAIKTIRPEHADSDAFRRMFLDEARLAARVAHANVVGVLDLGDERGIVYLAMELVEGDSVARLLSRRHDLGVGGLPPGVAARILADALCGLHAAHELTDGEGRPLNLVHRDVSPHNVLVGTDGVAKIADFGVAKARSRLADETDAGQVKGKFAYMAPEQLERRPIDRRSDVFSAGVLLWEMLTGARLFGGVDLLETIARLRDAPIPDPRRVAAGVPAPLAEVTMRALARDPASRFPTAAAMSDALDEAARACGVATTTKEAGALVAELCGDDLERRREAVRDAVRAVSRAGAPASMEMAAVAPQTLTATTTVVDPPARSEAKRAVRVGAAVVAAGVVAGAIGMIGLSRRADHHATAAAATTASAAAIPATTGAVGTASTPLPTVAAAPPVEGTPPNASSQAGPPPSASAGPVARPRPRATPTPHTPAPHVRYGNPYGR